jgi:hypothetical protein
MLGDKINGKTMNKLKEWIKQHQVTGFFILTYLASWLLFIPFLLAGISAGENPLYGIMALIGLFGPAIIQ